MNRLLRRQSWCDHRTVGYRVCLMLVLASMFGIARDAAAQGTAQIPLQFDFLVPGARSLALGSAFIAVADDATAAFTNPAGLTFLVKPEVSAELRYRRLETPFLAGGRLTGAATNNGVDTVTGAQYDANIDSKVRPYFLSFVYPGRQWAVSLYRHELVRQENSFTSAGTFQSLRLSDGSTTSSRDLPLSGTRTIKGDNYGASVAYRVSEKFSAGVGIAFYKLDLVADFARYNFQNSIFGPVNFAAQTATATQRGDGTAAAVNAGILVIPSPVVRFGVVYRQGASFDFTQTDTVGSSAPLVRTGKFRTPDVVGVGVRVQPRDDWSFSVDYDHIRYSRLKEDFINFQAISTGTENQLEVADGDEIHAGIEHVFTKVSHTPAVRGGIWYDPDHSVKYLSDNSGSLVDVRLKATLPGGDNLVHYCFGFGVPVSPAFEFNVGADLAKKRNYVSVSLVARFGK